jgi:competence protein ComEA
MRIDWKAYFTFSKRDRVGAIVLLILILIVAVTCFYNPTSNNPPITITTLDQELAKQGIDTTSGVNKPITYIPSETTEIATSHTSELFRFDPNTLDATGFKQLGLQDRNIRTILNYRSKGGHFRKPDDLRKIYGLDKEDADRLIPYIQIAGQQQTLAKPGKEQISYTKPKPAVIDINTATVEQWKALPAIGEVLSNRIVKFRDKIGGFTSITQVKQTYGLSDSAFQTIEPYLTITTPTKKTELPVVQKASPSDRININTASVNQLKSNSHIPENVARAIVIYRSQHGNFSSIEDVMKIVFINDEMFKQIAPFLTVE